MGRPKLFSERIQLPLPGGTTARIDALLDVGEYRLDFIRKAINAEVLKRQRLRDTLSEETVREADAGPPID